VPVVVIVWGIFQQAQLGVIGGGIIPCHIPGAV